MSRRSDRLLVSTGRVRRLKPALDRLYVDYDRAAAVADPVEILRRYRDPADREVAGFLAAALAFGRVASVLQTIERVLAVAGPAPASFVRTFDPSRHTAAFRSVVHRWTSGTDIASLVWIVCSGSTGGLMRGLMGMGLMLAICGSR